MLTNLVTATASALHIRPPIAQRTASSRALPSTTHPRVFILIPAQRIPLELQAGIRELAEGSARGNVSVVEGELKRGAGFNWVVGFRKDEMMKEGAMRITCNRDDFTDAGETEDFEVEIVYHRVTEGALPRCSLS